MTFELESGSDLSFFASVCAIGKWLNCVAGKFYDSGSKVKNECPNRSYCPTSPTTKLQTIPTGQYW